MGATSVKSESEDVTWAKFLQIVKHDACKSNIEIWKAPLATTTLTGRVIGTLVGILKNGYPTMAGPMCDYWTTPARLVDAVSLIPKQKVEISDLILSVYIRGATHHLTGKPTFVWDIDNSIKGGVLIRMAHSTDFFGISPNGGKWPEERSGSGPQQGATPQQPKAPEWTGGSGYKGQGWQHKTPKASAGSSGQWQGSQDQWQNSDWSDKGPNSSKWQNGPAEPQQDPWEKDTSLP